MMFISRWNSYLADDADILYSFQQLMMDEFEYGKILYQAEQYKSHAAILVWCT